MESFHFSLAGKSTHISCAVELLEKNSSCRFFPSCQDVKGPQTVAFNLPNDERIVNERGTSMVMLKNVSEAKFVSLSLNSCHPLFSFFDQKQRQHLNIYCGMLMNSLYFFLY